MTEKYASWLSKINALINRTLSIRAIVDPVGMTAPFGGVASNYPSSFAFRPGSFSCAVACFVETGCNIRGKRALIKYNWIAKSIVAISTTLGYFSGDVTVRLMALIILTNWVWIPFILYFDLAIRKPAKSHA